MRPDQRVRVYLRALFLVTIFFSSARSATASTETLLTTQTPQFVNASDGSSTNYELGAKFTSAVAGHITAIRFWKASRETGTHVGHVWNASGQLLVSVAFSNETSSGWQQQSLATPLAVNANTVYVVTVNTGNTYYVDTHNGFAAKVLNRDLSSVVGNNGVYGPAGRFPTSSWQASNYFRDVVFSPKVSAGLTSAPASLNLGNVNVGSSISQTLTLTNNASSTVTISKVAPTGTGLTVSGISVPFSLVAGKQVSLKVTFTPPSMGTINGSVVVSSNASNPSLTVALRGVGMQPQISALPTSVNFGPVAVGVSNTQTLTIKNSGNANLTISRETIAGSGFGITGPTLPATLTPGQSLAFNVRFSPATASSTTGTVSIATNAPHSPLVVALSGTGVKQSLQLSANPSALAYGSVTQGSSSKRSVTLTNIGNSSVSVSQLTPTGTYFSISGLNMPVSLAPGQTATFSVAFAPTTAGSVSGSVSVASTASNSPLSIPLSGAGVAARKATLSWTPSTSPVSGYNVYRGTQKGGPYTKETSSLVPGSTYTDLGVQAGLTYYYVVASVQSNGVESVYSSEVSATIP
ncbi:MAG: Fibronectin type domain protein [Candidatus Acidoferrum typicum]|nr:Fibronectin type domain protein [Candidatus Acidoferrum typicum]